jgi:hypothetical protein
MSILDGLHARRAVHGELGIAAVGAIGLAPHPQIGDRHRRQPGLDLVQ